MGLPRRHQKASITLGELCAWYVGLTEVAAKATYRTEISAINNLKRILGNTTKLVDLTPRVIEAYQMTRLAEASPRRIGFNVRPATVNREIACLQCMLNRAVRYKRLEINPISHAARLPEDNVRKRILASDEFEKLVAACPVHLQPVVILAYYSGMRKSDILRLTWDQVDLDGEVIRLTGDRTRTEAVSSIPLHPRPKAILGRLPKAPTTDRVFLRGGKPFDDCKRAFKTACAKAGLEDFTFQDLACNAVNNLRLLYDEDLRVWLSGRVQRLIHTYSK
jgi:integrase